MVVRALIRFPPIAARTDFRSHAPQVHDSAPRQASIDAEAQEEECRHQVLVRALKPGVRKPGAHALTGRVLSVRDDYKEIMALLRADPGEAAILLSGDEFGAHIYREWAVGWTILHEAADRGDVATLRWLLTIPGVRANGRDSTRSRTPLHIAAMRGHARCIQWLLQHGAAANLVDGEGRTALHMAAAMGDARSTSRLLKAAPALALQPSLPEGLYPLHEAASSGSVAILRQLLQAGAKIDARATDGTAAVHIACQRADMNFSAAILHAGADPNVKDKISGRAPLHTAIDQANATLVQLLLSQGADPYLSMDVPVPVDNVLWVHLCLPGEGWTPLHLACNCGNVEIFEMIMAALGSEGFSLLTKEHSQMSTLTPSSLVRPHKGLAKLVSAGTVKHTPRLRGREVATLLP
jgi:ankyrin repeat protein